MSATTAADGENPAIWETNTTTSHSVQVPEVVADTPAKTDATASAVLPLPAATIPRTSSLSIRASRFFTACCSCVRNTYDKLTSMSQFAVLSVASVAAIGLKSNSIKKTIEVLEYSWEATKNLFNDGPDSAVGIILGIEALNDLKHAASNAIGTIVTNGLGIVADGLGSAAYAVQMVRAEGGDAFYETIHNGGKWLYIPAAQAALNGASVGTSANMTFLLEKIIVINDIVGSPLSEEMENNLRSAVSAGLSALAVNAASLGLVAGLPILIYLGSRAVNSERCNNAMDYLRNRFCCCLVPRSVTQ